MGTQERLERMAKLKEGLIQNRAIVGESSEDGERYGRELAEVDEQMRADNARQDGDDLRPTSAFCPVQRKTVRRDYCETMFSGKACVSLAKCYD